MKTLITGTIIFSENPNRAEILNVVAIRTLGTAELERTLEQCEDAGVDWLVVEEYDGTIEYYWRNEEVV